MATITRISVECVARQLETMPHVMFGGLVHEPALRWPGG